jgi:hypothetical protein
MLHGLALCRVCAIAHSFVSGWRAFLSVSLCKWISVSLEDSDPFQMIQWDSIARHSTACFGKARILHNWGPHLWPRCRQPSQRHKKHGCCPSCTYQHFGNTQSSITYRSTHERTGSHLTLPQTTGMDCRAALKACLLDDSSCRDLRKTPDAAC